MKQICTFSESYTTEELWLDEKTKSFSIKRFHRGLIDDEERYDGETPVESGFALQKMIEYNKLSAVLQYYNELRAELYLDEVLLRLKAHSAIYDFGFMADKNLKYYKISENEYAIYYEKTFFNDKGMADFSVVRRILENKESVIYCEYDYFKNAWVSMSLYV